MLRILNKQGLLLELAVDQVITVEKRNPLFNDADKFFQDISYPFNAPFTQNNKAFFKLGHMVEASVDLYILPVQVFAEEILMVTGNVRYRVTETGFECTLEPNQTAINYLIKNAYLADIRTLDPDYVSGATTAAFNALMLESCQHPERYNYVFLPIKNEHLGKDGVPSRGYINYFSYDDQVFHSEKPSTPYALANTPFFKLVYVLKNIAEYLGFTAAGDIFTDPYYTSIYIYTRLAFDAGLIYPSMRYMPYMLLADVFKQLRQRWHMSIDINLSTRVITFRTLRTIKRSSSVVDLTPYITKVTEHAAPEPKGYKVSIKPDEQDPAQKIGYYDDVEFAPEIYLIVGDGSTPEEMECGTLHILDTSTDTTPGPIMPVVDQLMKNTLNDTYSDFPYDDPYNFNSANKWPLRFFRYNGMVEKVPGKFWPDGLSCQVDEVDGEYYQFLNDSKPITIEAVIPPAVISQFNITDKYCFRSKDGNYIYGIMDNYAYDKKGDEELVSTKLYLRTMAFEQRTPAELLPNDDNAPNKMAGLFSFNVYYDDNSGIKDLQLEIFVGEPGTGYTVLLNNIERPSSEKGVGGTIAVLGERQAHNQTLFELRIRQGKPQFMEYLGVRYSFTYDVAGYYKLTLPEPSFSLMQDIRWIKF